MIIGFEWRLGNSSSSKPEKPQVKFGTPGLSPFDSDFVWGNTVHAHEEPSRKEVRSPDAKPEDSHEWLVPYRSSSIQVRLPVSHGSYLSNPVHLRTSQHNQREKHLLGTESELGLMHHGGYPVVDSRDGDK